MATAKKNALYLAWLISLSAMFGSLYFSEVAGFAPCQLCWYQRIAMYPLAVIFTIAILAKDDAVRRYALPLSLAGLLIAAYHVLLQINLIPASAAPCTAGVSCLTRYIDWFGFIDIPVLSLLSFAGIFLLMLIYKKQDEI